MEATDESDDKVHSRLKERLQRALLSARPRRRAAPTTAADNHTALQRALLDYLVERGPALRLPATAPQLLRLVLGYRPELAAFEPPLAPQQLGCALHELRGLAPRAVYADKGDLMRLDPKVLADFRSKIAGAAAPPADVSPPTATSALPLDEPATAESTEMAADEPPTKRARDGSHEDLLELLERPTAMRAQAIRRLRTPGGSKLREVCPHISREACAAVGAVASCSKFHFRAIVQPHTVPSLGDCSYLDTCRHMATCKYVHYEVDEYDAMRLTELDAANQRRVNLYARHYQSQFINCDIRTFPMKTLGKFPVIMADPPWDIHMELPYGTMSDDEMRRMDVQSLQDDGVIFLWVTGRAMELGRECLTIWGYTFVQELLWVKINQIQRVIRTGRTGHWLNHSKEHCLIGIKGKPRINRNIDCDVVCAEVRETSRKPDEMYDLLERLAPGTRKLELFGRPHNVHKGWTTLGNQLGRSQVTEPWLREHLLREGVFREKDLAPLPPPPKDPIVPAWGGGAMPPPLGEADSA